MTRPFRVEEAAVALILVVWIPPAKVEVAVVVEVMTPVVSLPMEVEARIPSEKATVMDVVGAR